jgi:hypothetical protein
MSARVRFVTIAVTAAVMGGCGLLDPFQAPSGPVEVTVMTRNVYVGSDADFEDFDPEEIAGTFLATDFGARARGLAAEIAEYRPDLVGRQEVALVRLQSPGDPAAPAEDIFVDYLATLLSALATEGVIYKVAAIVDNADVEAPVDLGFQGDADLRLTDRDVILALRSVEIASSTEHNFEAARVVRVELNGEQITVPVLRGFVSVRAAVRGKAVRFTTSHLETLDDAATQLAQGRELIEQLDILEEEESLPHILVGDFNSPAPLAEPVGDTYRELIAGGFRDIDPGGPTCCHPPNLISDGVLLDPRIDLVLVRTGAGGETIRAEFVGIVGNDPVDRVRSSAPAGAQVLLWPSDHAGVVAKLVLEAEETS